MMTAFFDGGEPGGLTSSVMYLHSMPIKLNYHNYSSYTQISGHSKIMVNIKMHENEGLDFVVSS